MQPVFDTPTIQTIPYQSNYPVSRTSTFVNDVAQIKLGNSVFKVERKEVEDVYQYRLLARNVGSPDRPILSKIMFDTLGRLIGVEISNAGPLKCLGCNMVADGFTESTATSS